MGKQFSAISEKHKTFIENQKIFFVATAPTEGKINLSPKGLESLKVVNENTVIWLNLTGSGNETAAHLLSNPRMTLMFCAFEGKPLILRLYGRARVIHGRDADWQKYIPEFEGLPGARQIFEMKIEMVQASCGTGVPYFDYAEDRNELTSWAEKRGDDGLREYQIKHNKISLDGLETKIL